MLKKIAYYLFTLFIFTGCANLPSTNIPQNFNENDTQGMIIGAFSIKNEKPIFNGYGLYHSIIGGKDKLNVEDRVWIVPEQVVKMKLNPDFFDGEKGVYYFAFKKPAGDYHFNAITLFQNGGLYSSNAGMRIDIPFNVEKGKITYVGEIYLDYRNQNVTQNMLSERDLPKLKEKFQSINWNKLLR